MNSKIITSLILVALIVGCSNQSVLLFTDAYEQLTDEQAVADKGGYYYLEEEINEEVKNGKKETAVTYPEMLYFQNSTWWEASYGAYGLNQKLAFTMDSNTINLVSMHDGAYCNGSCNHSGKVIPKINGNSTQVFTRASSDELKAHETDDKRYNSASFISIFVTAVQGVQGAYSYSFDAPIPFLIRNDVSLSAYTKRLATPLSFSYNYTSNGPDKQGSGTITVSLIDSSSSIIKIELTNTLNNKDGSSWYAERISKFPIPERLVYSVDTEQKRIFEYSAETLNLVSQYGIGDNRRYSAGNIAKTKVSTKLCRYSQSSKVEEYNCK